MTSKPYGANGAAPKVSLTVEEKQQLIAKAEQEPTWSQSTLAKWATSTFCLYTPLNRTTVSKILLRADEIKSVDEFFLKRYNVTRPQFPELEEELVQWIIMVRKQGAGVTGAMIQAEAANIAARREIPKERFKCSNGWLERFQHRYREGIESTLRDYAEATGAPITSFGAAPAPRKSGAGKRGASGAAAVGAGGKKSALAGGKRSSKKVSLPPPPRTMLAALGVTSEQLAGVDMSADVVHSMSAAASLELVAPPHESMEQQLLQQQQQLQQQLQQQQHYQHSMSQMGQYRVDEAVAAAAAAAAEAAAAAAVAVDEHNALAAQVALPVMEPSGMEPSVVVAHDIVANAAGDVAGVPEIPVESNAADSSGGDSASMIVSA